MKPEIKGDIAKARLKQVEELVHVKNFEFRKKHQETLEILVEEKKGDFYVGFDQFYNKIHIETDKDILKNWLFIESYEVKEEGNYAQF